MGAIVGDLTAAAGRILSMEARGSSQVIRASPVGQMFGYAPSAVDDQAGDLHMQLPLQGVRQRSRKSGPVAGSRARAVPAEPTRR